MPAAYTVTGLGDAGVGMGNSGDLRYCINQADMQVGNNTITFKAGLTGTIDLNSSLNIAPTPGNVISVAITNPGGANTITVERALNAKGNFSLFSIGQGAAVTIDGLTITKGVAVQGGAIYTSTGVVLKNDIIGANQATGDGGGVYALNSVSLDNTIVSGNSAGGNGGGIFVFHGVGASDIKNKSLISGNTAQGSGGGIYFKDNDTGNNPLTILQSTVSGNTAKTGDGGGIWNGATVNGLVVQKSTIAGNTAMAAGKGGGIYNAGTAKLSNTTLNGNTANQGGGDYVAPGASTTKTSVTEAGNKAVGAAGAQGYSPGIAGGSYVAAGGTETVVDAIMASNNATDGSPDVFGAFTSLGYNLIGAVDGSTGFTNLDLTGTAAQPLNPMLNPLGDYGGPTQTMTLMLYSPARGAGNPNAVDGTTDQRGFARIVNGLTDIGAVEMQPGE